MQFRTRRNPPAYCNDIVFRSSPLFATAPSSPASDCRKPYPQSISFFRPPAGNRPRKKMMDDSRIIELYWKRSEQAVSETALKYGNYCNAVAYRILNDRGDAEECVNDTWLRAWNSKQKAAGFLRSVPPGNDSEEQSASSGQRTVLRRRTREYTLPAPRVIPFRKSGRSVREGGFCAKLPRIIMKPLRIIWKRHRPPQRRRSPPTAFFRPAASSCPAPPREYTFHPPHSLHCTDHYFSCAPSILNPCSSALSGRRGSGMAFQAFAELNGTRLDAGRRADRSGNYRRLRKPARRNQRRASLAQKPPSRTDLPLLRNGITLARQKLFQLISHPHQAHFHPKSRTRRSAAAG